MQATGSAWKGTCSIFINAPVDKVFSYIADLPRHSEWMPIESWEQWITSAGDTGEGTVFEAKYMTGSMRHDYFGAVTEFVPNKRFSYRLRSGRDVSHRSFDFESQGEGTLLTHHVRLTLAPLKWIVFPILRLRQHGMSMKALNNIKARMEETPEGKAA